MGVLRHSCFFRILKLSYQKTVLSARISSDYIKRKEGKSGIPQSSALCVMCITLCLMELWAAPFAGCGKAALAFPYAVNGVVHSGMGSYAHFHDAFLFLEAAFSLTSAGGVVVVPVRLFLCVFLCFCPS